MLTQRSLAAPVGTGFFRGPVCLAEIGGGRRHMPGSVDDGAFYRQGEIENCRRAKVRLQELQEQAREAHQVEQRGLKAQRRESEVAEASESLGRVEEEIDGL